MSPLSPSRWGFLHIGPPCVRIVIAPDRMPLYAVVLSARLMCRFIGDITSNTIATSIVRAGLATQPAMNLKRDVLFEAVLICCEETALQVLKEKGRKPQTET